MIIGQPDDERTCHIGMGLAKFAKTALKPQRLNMSTMNISLPDAMKSFVDEQVTNRGYGTSSEYLRDLIRRDQDRQHLRGLLLAGAAAPVVQEATPEYFNALRQQVRAKADAPAKPVRGARKSA